ncbi:MAG: HAD family hydrolase [Candidatus Hodarchaeota archaeon]
MKSFDLISFDLFNTLVYVNRSAYDPISSMSDALLQSREFKSHIMPVIPINEVIELYYFAIRKEMSDRTKEEEFSNTQILLNIWNKFEIEITQDLVTTANQILSYYFDSLMHLILPFPGLHDILTHLKESYILVLSSNHSFPENGWAVLHRYELTDYFSKIIFSGDIGWKKPSMKFFRNAFSSFGDINKNRILHIGDDPETDVKGALNFGIKALWIRPPHRSYVEHSELPGIEGVISELKEVNDFL